MEQRRDRGLEQVLPQPLRRALAGDQPGLHRRAGADDHEQAPADRQCPLEPGVVATYDGISIAWAVAEYLLTTNKKQAKTLFATHYWELTKLENEFPHAVNFQTAVQEIPSGIVFLRKIIKGGTDKSYGIHVAKLAGLPNKAIKRAEEMLKELEKKPESQLPLFISTPQEHPVLTELRKVDILNLTPLQAQHKLCELKEIGS